MGSDGDSSQDAEKLLVRCRQLSQRIHIQGKRAVAEYDGMKAEVESIFQALRDKQKAAAALPPSVTATTTREILSECEQTLRKGPGGDLKSHLKSMRKPVILSLLLGKHCPVHAVRRDEAFHIKEEYHWFRSQCAQHMLLLAGLLSLGLWHAHHAHGLSTDGLEAPRLQPLPSFSPIIMVGVQVFLVFMIYIYMAMAARESLLLMNGSNIRPWWIWHHYISAATCVVTLMLPVDSRSMQTFVEGWLHWSVLQAILMLAQNRYQRKRMYTRIALGKDSAMDVVGGETSSMPGQLLALLPALFFLQGWQIVLGARMVVQTGFSILNPEGWLEMEPHESDLRGLRGTTVVGMCMIGMGVMNAYNTVRTIIAKRRVAARRRAALKQA